MSEILVYIKQNAFDFSGLCMKQAVNILKEAKIKATNKKILDCFKQTLEGELYLYDDTDDKGLLIELVKPESDDSKRFRGKGYYFQVIGGVDNPFA